MDANMKEVDIEKAKESKQKKVDPSLECGGFVTDDWADECGCSGIDDCECLDLCYCC